MKKILLASAVVLNFCGTQIQASEIGTMTSAAQAIFNKLMEQLKKGADKNMLCRKGNIASGTFSLRSANGAACKAFPVAWLAKGICWDENIDSFHDSGCVQNFSPANLARSPEEARQKFWDFIKSPGQQILCKSGLRSSFHQCGGAGTGPSAPHAGVTN